MAKWRACAKDAPQRAEEDLRIATELLPKMLDAISSHVGRRTAATLAGIKGRRWGRIEEMAGESEGAMQAAARELVDAVELAEAQDEQRLTNRIKEAAADDWRAAAWVLERSKPKRWSNKVKDVAQEQVSELIEQLKVRVGEDVIEEAYAATSDGSAAGRKAGA